MKASALGRVTLANIQYDFMRLPIHVFSWFMRETSKCWRERNRNASLRRHVLLPDKHILATVRNAADTPSRGYCCQGPNAPYDPQGCSRVMNVDDFFENNLDWRRLGFILMGRVSERQVSRLARNGFKGAAIGQMRGRRPFAWITKSRVLRSTLTREITSDPSTTPANIARTWLGLAHFTYDEHLIEVIYPDEQIRGALLKAPTFIEGDTIVYCSRSGPDHWGRTINLESMAEGLPEAVVGAMPCDERCKINDLGRLKPSKYEIDWDTIDMPERWTDDSIVRLPRI
jgi:hypothetical protein